MEKETSPLSLLTTADATVATNKNLARASGEAACLGL